MRCWQKRQILASLMQMISIQIQTKVHIQYLTCVSFIIFFFSPDYWHLFKFVEKMRNGIPLSEEDRIPWLEMLRDALGESLVNRRSVIVGCSALQKRYREILRCADPNYEPESYVSVAKFVLLDAEADVLAARLEKRAAEGKHFMPSSLLRSQLEMLRIDDSEEILKVDATLSPQVIVETIQALIIKTESPSDLKQ